MIKRNYFFEDVTEELPTVVSNDPNYDVYDKTDSYSQTVEVGDEEFDGVVGTVLGDGKEEDLNGDGAPSLEQALYEETLIDEATSYILEAKLKTKEEYEKELDKIENDPNAGIKAVGWFRAIASVATFAGGVGTGAAIGHKIDKTVDKTNMPSVAKFGLAAAGGSAVGLIVGWAAAKAINVILKQPVPAGMKYRHCLSIVKDIDKTIKKAEKAKAKAEDPKKIEKQIKQLESAKAKAQKKADKMKANMDAKKAAKKESTEFDFFGNILNEEAGAPDPTTVTVSEAFYGDDYMENVIMRAMTESYTQDLALMNYIANSSMTINALSEADISIREEAADNAKQGIVKKIIEAIKKFGAKIKEVVAAIINKFKSLFKKNEKFVQTVEKAVGTKAEEYTVVDPAIDQDMIEDVIAMRDELMDFSFEEAIDYVNQHPNADVSAAIKWYRDNGDKAVMDMMNRYSGLKKSDVERTVFNNKLKDIRTNTEIEEATLLEAEGEKKYSIKKLVAWFKALGQKINIFSKIKARLDSNLKKTESKIAQKKDLSNEDASKVSKMFSAFKQAAMGKINDCIALIKKAYHAVLGGIKKIAGKVFKKKQPKNEMAQAVSEAALGELIYSTYVSEADTTEVADGVDVTDTISGVIDQEEKDACNTLEGISKEKTVTVNNEQYRVKTTVTKL